MSSPCGKCNTCPCGTSGGAPPPQQPSHRPPPTYAQQPAQQQESCPYPRAQGQGQQQGQGPAGCQVSSYQPQQQAGTCAAYNQPRAPQTVECTCTQNRVRGQQPTIQADHVTCGRGPREQPPIMETRCTCREPKKPEVECHCAPPAPQPQVQCPPPPPPTHANVTCGQSVRRGPQPYQRHSNQTSCGHCRSQQKKKKCVIQ